jgi:DNA-binding winged helix-turn-helix (wHTH) protein
MEFVFGNHRLDVDRRELRRGTELIPVEPQVFDILVYLLQNRDRVVSKDDLLRAAWARTDRRRINDRQPDCRRTQSHR